jgi:hypothetical protein
VHAAQLPDASQTPPAHADPAGALPVALQTGAPLEHTRLPVRHAVVGVQLMPLVHATHVPEPLHTPPAHAVPEAALPLAMQTGAPVAQWVVPVVHGSPVEHDAPSLQVTHAPEPSHTPPVQEVPAVAFPIGMHTAAPDEQTSEPVRHGSDVGMQAIPATHGEQVPAPSHTPPVHIVPGAECPLAVQTGEPLSHEIVPVVQGSPVEHEAPD